MRSMLRFSAAVAATCLAMPGAALVANAQTTAQLTPQTIVAASRPCPAGWLCLWQDENYQGRMLQFRDVGYDQDLAQWNFRQKTSSVWNRTARTVHLKGQLATGVGSVSRTLTVLPGEMMPNLESEKVGLRSNWNDRIDSIRIN